MRHRHGSRRPAPPHPPRSIVECMRADEMRDSGAAAGAALAEVVELTRDVHRALAARIFDLAGARARPVREIYDRYLAVTYGAVRLGVRTLPETAGVVAAAVRAPTADSVADTPRGHYVLGALSGWAGDRLAVDHRSIVPPMGMRTHTGRVRQVPANVAYDVRDCATGRLVVFVHGLCENDRFWWIGAEKRHGDPRVTYGSLLHDEHGWTPLYLNYNSGLHVSDNGHQLADWLEQVILDWPVPVREIALVGHSMGGLVARSAAHHGEAGGLAWIRPLRHIVGLGTPHTGAPLERLTNAGMHALARLPETLPIATYLNRRSAGIKDLRYGSVVEADWSGFDPDERLTDRSTAAALLPGVAYSMAAATLSRNPHGPFAHDLLVQHASAHGTGPTRRIDFDADRLFHVGGKHHLSLLNDRLVYEQLGAWLNGADGAEGRHVR
jgi:hypothetical protein